MNGQTFIIGALRRAGTARRGQPLKPPAKEAAAAEFLYVPCVCGRHDGYPDGTRRWVQGVPIVKKTAKLIYYTSETLNWREAVVTPGCISRERFESAGVIPIPGHRHRRGPAGRLFYATREAAERDLVHLERGRAAREVALIKELRRAMADAHPDHGGTADQFIQARRRYQAALQRSTSAEGPR